MLKYVKYMKNNEIESTMILYRSLRLVSVRSTKANTRAFKCIETYCNIINIQATM